MPVRRRVGRPAGRGKNQPTDVDTRIPGVFMHLTRVRRGLSATAIGLFIVLGSNPTAAQETASAPESKSATTAVYTEAQADRGEQVFAKVCSFCHKSADFSGPTFQTTWKGLSVGEFFSFISSTMPQDKPGSLTPQQYVDVLSYILELNANPPGKTELPPDAKLLQPFVFEFK